MPKYIDIEISQKKYCNITLKVDDDTTLQKVQNELRQEFCSNLRELIKKVGPYWDDSPFNDELEIENINEIPEVEALQYKIIKYEE